MKDRTRVSPKYNACTMIIPGYLTDEEEATFNRYGELIKCRVYDILDDLIRIDKKSRPTSGGLEKGGIDSGDDKKPC